MNASTFSFIVKLYIPISIVLGWLIHKERFGWKTTAGLIISFVGVAVMMGSPEFHNFLGVALSLGAAFTAGLGVNLMHGSVKTIDFPTFSFYCCAFSCPFALAGALLFDPPILQAIEHVNLFIISGVLLYQVVLMSLCLYWWKELMNRNRVENVSSFSFLTTVFAVLGGIILLGESLHLYVIIGGLITMIGVGVIVLQKLPVFQK